MRNCCQSILHSLKFLKLGSGPKASGGIHSIIIFEEMLTVSKSEFYFDALANI